MGLKESNKTQQSQVCIFFGPALIDTEPTTLTLRKLPINLFFLSSNKYLQGLYNRIPLKIGFDT